MPRVGNSPGLPAEFATLSSSAFSAFCAVHAFTVYVFSTFDKAEQCSVS
ncbi:hypothetical protein STRTUCAR8_04943 [Streptomyces turgidiscabies Car8]|uniref:Uncharacterized protein n=1 Tax=Streptomyces turgidiscabies (strain Car8) TaxID=698760 RepID=L7FB64_STRT8|nr:hypothetical protein STRTUCAR8_04943 [Streptomyces turgidiscabies Car8]